MYITSSSSLVPRASRIPPLLPSAFRIPRMPIVRRSDRLTNKPSIVATLGIQPRSKPVKRSSRTEGVFGRRNTQRVNGHQHQVPTAAPVHPEHVLTDEPVIPADFADPFDTLFDDQITADQNVANPVAEAAPDAAYGQAASASGSVAPVKDEPTDELVLTNEPVIPADFDTTFSNAMFDDPIIAEIIRSAVNPVAEAASEAAYAQVASASVILALMREEVDVPETVMAPEARVPSIPADADDGFYVAENFNNILRDDEVRGNLAPLFQATIVQNLPPLTESPTSVSDDVFLERVIQSFTQEPETPEEAQWFPSADEIIAQHAQNSLLDTNVATLAEGMSIPSADPSVFDE